MNIHTWEHILSRDDIVGGDIRHTAFGLTYQGPIRAIERVEGNILFHVAWVGQTETGRESWELLELPFTVEISTAHSLPRLHGDGSISFEDIYGDSVLYPRNDSRKLSSVLVKNLPKDWRRLLSLYPDLVFTYETARSVCRKQQFSSVVRDMIDHFSPRTDLAQFLELFKESGTAEEFLWYYIEAVTGEKDVCDKVY